MIDKMNAVISGMTDEIYGLHCEIGRLETENAKLRELACEMLIYIAYPYVCFRPEVLVERARELGIEVEG